jgi:hypothetical protein
VLDYLHYSTWQDPSHPEGARISLLHKPTLSYFEMLLLKPDDNEIKVLESSDNFAFLDLGGHDTSTWCRDISGLRLVYKLPRLLLLLLLRSQSREHKPRPTAIAITIGQAQLVPRLQTHAVECTSRRPVIGIRNYVVIRLAHCFST